MLLQVVAAQSEAETVPAARRDRHGAAFMAFVLHTGDLVV